MIRGNIIFSERASSDVRSIKQWYNDQRENLGEDFILSINNVLIKVGKHPSSFRYVDKDVRRCKVKKFPYYIYFTVNKGAFQIVVLKLGVIVVNLGNQLYFYDKRTIDSDSKRSL